MSIADQLNRILPAISTLKSNTERLGLLKDDGSKVTTGDKIEKQAEALENTPDYVSKNGTQINITTPNPTDTYTIPRGYHDGTGKVNVSVPAGTVKSGTSEIETASVTYMSSSQNYSVTGSATIAQPSVISAGYISDTTGTKQTNTATLDTTLNRVGIKATNTASGDYMATPVISRESVGISGVTDAASGNATTSRPSSGVYVKVKSASKTGTVKSAATVIAEGYGTTTTGTYATTGDSTTVGAAASADTYVPIKVGTIKSGSVTINNETITYDSSTGRFNVDGTATIPAPSVESEGYVTSSVGTKQSGTATIDTTLDKVLGSTAITGTKTYTPTISRETISINNVVDAASGRAVTTAPSSGVYVKVKSASGTGTITATPSVTSAGYGTSANHGINGATDTITMTSSSDTYVPITETSATVNGKTVSYGSGWIRSGSKSVNNGAYAASIEDGNHTVSVPTVTPEIGGTVTNITSTSKPTGTDGVDYWLINPNATSTSGKSSVIGTATVTASGWLEKGSTTSVVDEESFSPTIAAGTNRYLKKANITSSGSDAGVTVTAGTTSHSVSSNIVTSSSATDYYITTTATGGSASTPEVAVSVGVGYNPELNTTKISAKTSTGSEVAKTTYIQKGVLGASTSTSAGSATMTANGIVTSGTSTSYYVTLSTAPGSATGTASVNTAGIVEAKSTFTKTSTASVDVNPNVTRINIPASTCTVAGGTLSTNMSTGTSSDGFYVSRAAVTDAHTAGYTPKKDATTTIAASTLYIKKSSTGDAVTNTSDSATLVLDPGKQVTIGQGYYDTPRIIRASIADVPEEAVNAAGFSLNVANKSATVTVGSYNSSTDTYPITASIDGTMTASTPGWFSSATASETEQIGSMKKATSTVNIAANPSATIATQPTASATVTIASTIKTTTTNTGYTISASANANSGNSTASVGKITQTDTSGFLPAGTKTIQEAQNATSTAVSKSASETKYIQKGVLGSSTTVASNATATMSAKGFTAAGSNTTHYVSLTTASGSANSTATVATEGYVKTENSTSSVAVPVTAGTTRINIPDASITSGSAEITSVAVGANGTTDFTVIGSAAIGAPSVGTEGYISSNTGGKNGNTATLNATLNKIEGETIISGTTTYKPTISRNTISITNVEDAASGAATTTAPSKGVYVKVKSAATTGTITATPNVTSAGYGTAGLHGLTSTSATIGASASSDTYVPIAVGDVTSGTATISTASFTYNSTNDNFKITGSGNVTAPTVNTAGWVSPTNGTKSSNTNGATLNTTVAKIGIKSTNSTTGNVYVTPVISRETFSLSGVTDAASGAATTTAPSSGVYVKVKSAANNGTVNSTPSVESAGYGTTTQYASTGGTAVTAGAKASADTYVPITTTSATVSGDTVSYGTGWISGGSNTVASGTIKSGSATISSATFTYNTSSSKFDVTGSATVSAPSVTTAGYVSSTKGTKNTNTASLSTSVSKVGIKSTNTTSGTVLATPVISRETVSISNVIDAASGNATTTAPSTGIYVKVKSAESKGTVSSTASVTSAGYGTTSQYSAASAATTSAGANASADTYIPIKAGALSATVSKSSNASATMGAQGFTSTSTSTSHYVTLTTGSGSVYANATVSTEGYVTTANNKNTSDSKTSVPVDANTTRINIPDGAYSSAAEATKTDPTITPSISGNITTITSTSKPSGTNGTDYWTIDPNATVKSNGSASASATAAIGTAGFLETGTKTSTSSVAVSATIEGGTNYYLKKATTSTSSGTVTATSGSASVSVSGIKTTSTSNAYKITATATGGNASTPAISATVGVGYNPSAVTSSVAAKSATGTTATSTLYVQAGSVTPTVTTIVSGTASMTATSVLTSTSGTHYITLTTSNGSAKAQATVSEGYVVAGDGKTSSAATVGVTGNGDKIYIKDGSATPSVTNIVSGKATLSTGSIATHTTQATGDYAISVTTSNGSAKATTTVSEGYIVSGGTSSAATVNVTGATTVYVSKAKANKTSLNCGESATISAGYTDASITISANSLSSQTSATAASGEIITGKTAWVNGTKLTGTLVPNYYYTGSTTPSSTLGNNGDLYLIV